MAYINFKEERYAGENELKKRKENNDKIIKTIINDKSNISLSYCEKYSFNNFKNRTFNNSKVQNEDEFLKISYENIVCSVFEKCKFYNIHFIDCNFIGCKAIDCDFGGGGVIFENCIFVLDEINNVPSLNVKDNLSCSFEKCKLYCKFLNTNISYLIMEECEIKNTNFELSDMSFLLIKKCDMKKIDMIDVDLSSARILNSYIEDLEFNDKYQSKIDDKTFFDTIPLTKKDKKECDGIYKTYETYADICKANSFENNFGEYYFLCKKVQRKTLKFWPKVLSTINYLSCGYGERVEYALFTSGGIILLFAALLLIFGIKYNGEVVQYITGKNIPGDLMGVIHNINYSISLSVEMFCGIGADVAKPTEMCFWIGDIENILGIIMTGLAIGTITRKLVR